MLHPTTTTTFPPNTNTEANMSEHECMHAWRGAIAIAIDCYKLDPLHVDPARSYESIHAPAEAAVIARQL